MESFSIYKFLWQLLHWFIFLYELCIWLRFRIIAFALWSYDLCRTPAEREQNEYDFLQQCKQHLNKIPKHLNLIIGPGNQQVNDELLTRIFSYAIHMNINCVSYYDTRYTNETNLSTKKSINLENLKCPKGWKSKNEDAHHVIWYTNKDSGVSNGSKDLNGTNICLANNTAPTSISSKNSSNTLCTNGHLPPSPPTLYASTLDCESLEIFEIIPQNNRPLLVQVCRELFQQRKTEEIQQLLKQRNLLTERLTQELAHHLHNLTEPELSIIFYENLCTFGLLPWHTRFTEFHRHATGQRFDVKTFANILYKFARCEQRWGK